MPRWEKHKKGHLCETPRCMNAKPHQKRFCWNCIRKKYEQSRPNVYHFNQLKFRAKRRQVPFSLTQEDFDEFCKETGYLELKGRNKRGLHIDRIKCDLHVEGDNLGAYEKGNIRVLTCNLNTRRQNYAIRDKYGDAGNEGFNKEIERFAKKHSENGYVMEPQFAEVHVADDADIPF